MFRVCKQKILKTPPSVVYNFDTEGSIINAAIKSNRSQKQGYEIAIYI